MKKYQITNVNVKEYRIFVDVKNVETEETKTVVIMNYKLFSPAVEVIKQRMGMYCPKDLFFEVDKEDNDTLSAGAQKLLLERIYRA